MLSKLVQVLTVMVVLAGSGRVLAQGTAFLYQGQLSAGGVAVTGTFDFRFGVYDAATNGNQISYLVTNAPVGVTNGLFVTTLDFWTNVFTGPARWLDIGVRTNGSAGSYTALVPRQPLLAAPYAIFAGGASNLLGSLQATQLLGTVSASQISGTYTNPVNFGNAGDTFSGTFAGGFSGNGSGLTNLNGAAVSSGTVADVRLSTNVAFLNGNQTFSGTNSLTNWNNSFQGSFFGNGLVGWTTVPSNTLNAVQYHGYTLTSPLLTTVTLPTGLTVGTIIRLAGAGAGGWLVQCSGGQSIVGNFMSFSNALWNPVSSSPIVSGYWAGLAGSADGSRLVAASGAGGVYTSVDGGSQWTGPGLGSFALHAVASSGDGTHLFAAVTNGYIYSYSGSGTTWNTISPASANYTSLATSAGGNIVLAAVYGGYLQLSINGGTSWSQVTSPGVANWTAVACSASGSNLVAAANNGPIWYSTTGGSSWAQGTSSPNAVALAGAANGSNFLAATTAGALSLSTNSGANWFQLTGAPSTVSAVSASADGTRLAATVNGGRIYLSSNGGLTWTPETEAPSTNWCSVTLSADGTHIAAAALGNGGGAGAIYTAHTTAGAITGTSVNGSLLGSQGSAVELQYIGNNQFMPVSSAGQLWAF